MKKLVTFAVIAGTLTLTLPADAQFARPESAIKYRQSAMYIMNQNAGRLFAMVQGKTPFDAKAAADSAAIIEFASKLPWGAFGDGTDKASIPTRAKSEIWTERTKFTELSEKLQVEAGKLNAAAKTGNLDNIKAAMGGVGTTCNACHDSYQAKQ